MNRWTEIATLAATRSGSGYEHTEPWGNRWVSNDGLDEMIRQQHLLERFRPALDAFSELLHVWCAKHNRPLTNRHGEPFEWSICDYGEWGADERSPLFMLYGWHQFSEEFCIAAWARGTLDGSLIACEGDWRADSKILEAKS